MPFWSENFGENSQLKDPKRKFRFTGELQGIDAGATGGAAMWYAKSCTKPSFQIESAEHKYLNHTFYYPGSVTWQEVDIKLVDPANPDMTATLSDIVVQSGYTPPTNATSLSTMSKAKAAGALGAVIITQIDADGNPVETWTLWNAFVTEVTYGELAYGEDDLIELGLKLKYDWARVETVNGSVTVAGAGQTEFFNV